MLRKQHGLIYRESTANVYATFLRLRHQFLLLENIPIMNSFCLERKTN